MRRVQLQLTGDGAVRRPLYGYLANVYLVYSGHTATADVTLFEQVDANERTLLTVTDNTTSGNYPVVEQAVDNTGSAIDGQYGYPHVAGDIVLRVAQGQAAGTVTAYLWIVDDGPQQGRS